MNIDNFIFHSDFTPFAITQGPIELSVSTGNSISGNSSVSYYSDWVEINGEQVAPMKQITYPDGERHSGSRDYVLATNITARPDVEFANGKVRGRVTVDKVTSGTGTYTQMTFPMRIFMVQVLP